MKLLRLAGLVVFILSSAAFSFYRLYERYSIDSAGPDITFPTDTIYTEVNVSEDVLLEDVRAFDEKDGDVSDSLIVENISKFVSPGKRIITYAAFDDSNNVTKKERYLVYTDYKSPRFSLSKPLSFIIGDYIDIIEYMTVYDCIDGDLSNNIRYELMDDNFGEIESEFKVKFWVTNSCGDTSYLPVTVEYHYPGYNILTPVISLDDYIIYIDKGSKFYPDKYPKGFIVGGNEYSFLEQSTHIVNGKSISKSMIRINSNVNTDVPGVYYVNYMLTIDDGLTGNTRMIVVVE